VVMRGPQNNPQQGGAAREGKLNRICSVSFHGERRLANFRTPVPNS
jgi:hypothetical protein